MADLSELIKAFPVEQQNEIMEQFKAAVEKKDKQIEALKAQNEEMSKSIAQASKNSADIAKLQEQLKKTQEEYELKVQKMQYEAAAKEMANTLKFTSKGAKKVFLEGLNQTNNPLVNGKIQGFNDYTKQFKAEDPGAFIVEEKNETKEVDQPLFAPSIAQFGTTFTESDRPKTKVPVDAIEWYEKEMK